MKPANKYSMGGFYTNMLCFHNKRDVIKAWFNKNGSLDPLTGQPLVYSQLQEDKELKARIRYYATYVISLYLYMNILLTCVHLMDTYREFRAAQKTKEGVDTSLEPNRELGNHRHRNSSELPSSSEVISMEKQTSVPVLATSAVDDDPYDFQIRK